MKFLYEKEGKVFAACETCGKVLKFQKYQLDEIKDGVECFCGEIGYAIRGMKKSDDKPSQQIVYQQPQYVGPRCPTCGSTSVQRISIGSKVVGGAMFGLFSSNIRNSMRCNSCGCKW